MNSSMPNLPMRALFLVTTPKHSDKASEVLRLNHLPYQFRLSALGTAPSEIMDLLGLGNIDKTLTISLVPKSMTGTVCKQLKKSLKLGSTNSGIGFTLPLNAMNRLMLKSLSDIVNQKENESARKEESVMTQSKYVVIAAVVNPGFSENVMAAARSAGARGGTVVHSHQISDDTASSLGVSEEKEIVLIVAKQSAKVEIMKSISQSCGVKTEAEGNILSLPIDDLIGIDIDDDEEDA